MIYYSEMENDIREITDYANKHGYYFDSPKEVSCLWERFSNYYWEPWLGHDEGTLEKFIDWLEYEEVESL